MSYDNKCYKLFVPVSEKESKPIQDLGYSKAEALEHCLKRGGKLLDIGSQVKYFNKINIIIILIIMNTFIYCQYTVYT